MATTSDKITSPGDRAGPIREDPVSPYVEFRLALGLYALWAALAWVSVETGQASLARHAAVVLLVGVLATNALFLLIARSNTLHRPPTTTITLAQCVMGITWATLFSFMSSGIAELVVGMYLTAILFALPRVRLNALTQLAVFATLSYAVVQVVKVMLTAPERPLWPELIGTAIFATVVALLVASRHQRDDDARSPASGAQSAVPDWDDEAQLVHAVNRRHTVNALAREKGRADRTNHPFTICILDVDDIDQLAAEHGPEAAELVLRRFARRARGELRAMDGVSSVDYEGCVDRLGHEQFIVILPQTTLGRAARCADRILRAAAKYAIDGRYAITVSAGVAQYRRGERVCSLLDRAEAALARAQDAGGNRAFGFEPADRKFAEVVRLDGTRT